jgi:hypothetical protein
MSHRGTISLCTARFLLPIGITVGTISSKPCLRNGDHNNLEKEGAHGLQHILDLACLLLKSIPVAVQDSSSACRVQSGIFHT